MSNSPNMGMPIPVVGTTPGPTWAQNIVDSLNIIDAHTHAQSSGAPVSLNITADVSWNSFSLTALKKTAFTSQSSTLSGSNFLSFIGGNLYVNDGSSNTIQMTSGGNIVAGGGSITGSFTGGAGVSFASSTYTFLSATLKAGAIDHGASIIRETGVSSAKGITLASPSSLAADYQLTLPAALPASTRYFSSDNSGNMAFATADTIVTAANATTSWNPLFTPSSGTINTSHPAIVANYWKVGNMCFISFFGSFSVTSGTPTFITFPLPITPNPNALFFSIGTGVSSSNQILIRNNDDGTNAIITPSSGSFTGSQIINFTGFYGV